VLLGGGFLLQKGTVYESKLIYSVDTIPPFYEKDKALTDFQNKFYSVNVFEEWSQNNSDTSLVFEDFTATKVVDGFVLSTVEGGRLATLVSDKKGPLFIRVKSNQLPLLNDFFKYTTHVNATLKKEYIRRAKEELNIIETRFKDFSTVNGPIISTILSIDRYIASAEGGASVINVHRPTMPKKVSPMYASILAVSVVFGGVVGVFFVLVRNAITKRKERLAKA
jgi:hypothetical protein